MSIKYGSMDQTETSLEQESVTKPHEENERAAIEWYGLDRLGERVRKYDDVDRLINAQRESSEQIKSNLGVTEITPTELSFLCESYAYTRVLLFKRKFAQDDMGSFELPKAKAHEMLIAQTFLPSARSWDRLSELFSEKESVEALAKAPSLKTNASKNDLSLLITELQTQLAFADDAKKSNIEKCLEHLNTLSQKLV